MVLRPAGLTERPQGGFVSAWEAIAGAQKKVSANYNLVRQPDHAWLSGQIVEHFAIPGAPSVDDDIVRGISLHDEGWSEFDSGRERLHETPVDYSADGVPLNAEGKPLSFLEIRAGDFLRAWNRSIEAAEAVGPIAGLIVSGHFRRIGRFGIGTGTYSEEDTSRVREFIAREEGRQRRLFCVQNRGEREVEYWTDVLQFCDLLSLYLCCGSEESIEFPQRIGPKGETIRLRLQDGVNVLSPSPFAQQVELSLRARPYPAPLRESFTKLSWQLQ